MPNAQPYHLSNSLKYILIFGAFLILLLISALYSPVWYDDAGHFIVARELSQSAKLCYPVDLANGLCDPNSPYITMGPALTYPLAAWMKIFGTGMGTARLLMVLLSLASLAAFAFLSRQVQKPAKVIWALLLVLGNVQLLTYGAEVLAEVPMLGGLFLGFVYYLKAGKDCKWKYLLAAGAAWAVAILSKEYIAVPLGLAIMAWLVRAAFQQNWKAMLRIFVMGFGIVSVVLLWYIIRNDGISGMMDYLEIRRSYGSEFLALNFTESLRFLSFKPLILLGTLALIVKVYYRRGNADSILLIFHLAHLLFFLVSAGYDRFGFQLLFIPAIYLSEFILLIWNRASRNRKIWGRLVFIPLFILLFSQQTLPIFTRRILGDLPVNTGEKYISQQIQKSGAERVYTYDQQLAPFLPAGIELRLPIVVPSNTKECQAFDIQPGEYYVQGNYGATVFLNCQPLEGLILVAEHHSHLADWVLYRRP